MDSRELAAFIEERNAFSSLLGIRVRELSPGYARCEMEIEPKHENLFGTVNAGALYTLAETAFGAAINGHGRVAVAANLTIAYVKPARSGLLTAVAEEISLGNRLGTYDVKVFDEEGDVVALVQATGYRLTETLDQLAGA